MYWSVLGFGGHTEAFRSDRTCSEKKKRLYIQGMRGQWNKCDKTLTIDYLGKENRVLFCFVFTVVIFSVGCYYFKVQELKIQHKIFFLPMIFYCARRILTLELLYSVVLKAYSMCVIFDEEVNLMRYKKSIIVKNWISHISVLWLSQYVRWC